MKALIIGTWSLAGRVQNLILSSGFDDDLVLRLEGFACVALMACLLFGYGAWRWEAERRWRRVARGPTAKVAGRRRGEPLPRIRPQAEETSDARRGPWETRPRARRRAGR